VGHRHPLGDHPRASATLHAGAGIVRGSDPDAELAETTLKFAGVLEALSQGASSLLR